MRYIKTENVTLPDYREITVPRKRIKLKEEGLLLDRVTEEVVEVQNYILGILLEQMEINEFADREHKYSVQLMQEVDINYVDGVPVNDYMYKLFKEKMLLETIAEVENLSVSEEEFQKNKSRLAKVMGVKCDKFDKIDNSKSFAFRILLSLKIAEFLYTHVKFLGE